MEREAALRLLAESDRLALLLRDEGLDAEGISRVLDIPVEAVDPLLRVATAKLARLMSPPGDFGSTVPRR